MGNPTLTAQNEWLTQPGQDFLQLNTVGSGLVSWIDSSGFLQGNLNSNGPAIVYATSYGVKADAKTNCYGIIHSGSNQVQVGSPGTQFTQADQGSFFEATSTNCSGGTQGNLLISGYICAVGGFVNATTVNICTTPTGNTPANATGTCLGNVGGGVSCATNWGLHDDTAAWNAAFAAVTNVCGILIMPAGRSIITAPIQATPGVCSLIGGGGNAGVTEAFRVKGQGPQVSVLVPWNTFNAATCSGNGFNACLFAIPIGSAPVAIGYDHFGVDGGGIPTVTNGNNHHIFYMPGPGNYQDITVTNWGNSNTNWTAFAFGGNSGDLATCFNCYSYFGGSQCFSSGGLTALFGMDCFNAQGSVINGVGSPQSCTEMFGGNIITTATTANGGALTVNGGATTGCFMDFGSYLTNAGGAVLECGGNCFLTGTTLFGQGSSISTPLYMQDGGAHAGTAHLSKVMISNSAQTAIGGGIAGSTVYDECGNTLQGTFNATNISFTPCLNGPTFANVPALSGTGACATITTQLPATSGAWSGSFKCTGVTGAATVTITFGFTAPNGWMLNNAFDITTVANTLHQNSSTTTTVVIGAAAITSGDVINWSASPF